MTIRVLSGAMIVPLLMCGLAFGQKPMPANGDSAGGILQSLQAAAGGVASAEVPKLKDPGKAVANNMRIELQGLLKSYQGVAYQIRAVLAAEAYAATLKCGGPNTPKCIQSAEDRFLRRQALVFAAQLGHVERQIEMIQKTLSTKHAEAFDSTVTDPGDTQAPSRPPKPTFGKPASSGGVSTPSTPGGPSVTRTAQPAGK